MKSLNRREFMMGTVGAAASLTVLPQSKSRAAGEKIIMGVMGLGGRGTYLAEKFAARPDVEVAYLSDPNTRRFARAREAVEEAQDTRPKMVQDFRKILDDKSVDVLINATPDHWHGLGTIMACQAGKDVYVEKPMAHNIFEGRKMVEATRKYKRVVQVGMQSRTAAYTGKAKEYIQSGKMGDIHLVRVFNMMQHPKQRDVPDQPVPEGFDYDMWCGPARPIPGDAVHQLDLARYLMGDIPYPKTVAHAGGVYALRDGRQTPDTQLATFEYDSLTLMMEATLWTPYIKKIPGNIRDSDRFPDWPFCSTRVEILGTEGFMYYGRHGGGWQAYDANGELVRSEYGRQADKEHQDNFIDCIRTRKRPNADVEIGHQTVLLCHMANISYRVGNQKLELDPRTERFTNCDEANKYLKREYRKPWIVPENV
ncbi:MAG: Gfo/Idh/MocA family protein [Planctomycetota bacterium]|jgi:predicted dehydrogenase